MQLFDSPYFMYKNNELYCEGIPISDIVSDVGTPTYIYSKNFMVDSFNNYSKAFSEVNHKIFYACKANFNISIIKLFSELGAGIDVNSSGEFYRAQKAGVSPKNIILSGVGKTIEEIRIALENDIDIIKVESEGEIELIDQIAKQLGKKANIAIRVNPNVDPATHPYISTGLAENKFGIDESLAENIFMKAKQFKNIFICGIDMHIGSQITKLGPYAEAIDKLVSLIISLKKFDINIKHLDIGGGMGITYYDEKPFSPQDFAKEIIPIISEVDCTLYLEPGRSLTANGGCLVSEVLYKKQNLKKNFLVIDGAMNDLLRPSLYNAYHHIQPVNISNSETIVADVVGPICESGDFFAKNREIIASNPGDLVTIMSAGAYGMVMSSNYNSRPRPAEVLVSGNEFNVIRKRETIEQLMQNE